MCYTCNGPSALNCTSCATGYLLIGSSCKQPVLTCPAYSFQGYCVNSCPSTSFAVGMICTLCINNCLTCQSATICLTCLQNYYYNATAKTCVVLCPQGTYADSTATCQLCPSVCSTCRLIVSTVSCLLCAVNHYILNGTCIANCPSSTHIIQLTHCIPCL